jgi:UDP-glucose 4-epimerase
MKILITGGAGFIGSHLAARFAESHEVWVFDDLSSGKLENLEGARVHFIHGSILDPKTLRDLPENIDWVFHLAAMTSVADSMNDPLRCIAINTSGTVQMLEWAKHHSIKKFVFASSASVYGDSLDLPKKEGMRPDPKSPYAVSKLDGEYFCRIFTHAFSLPTVCLRFFNVFGPRQNALSAYAAAMPVFFEKAIRNQEIKIHGDGSQTRDFIYIDDIVSALAFVAESPEAKGVFNLGYGDSISINDLVQKIKELTFSSSSLRYTPERSGDVRHSVAAVDEIMKLGFKFSGNLEQGLAKLASSYLG